VGSLLQGGIEVEIEDRLLAHLQIVIVQKFRRDESLLMSWLDARESGGGRSAIWLHSSSTVYFKFLGSKSPTIERDWLKRLTDSANSSSGLILQDQDGNLTRAVGLRRRA
jgi:hypothetical protein